MSRLKSTISNREFICLMAILMSLLALTVDAMLPALNQIGESLGIQNPNDNQLIISSIFLGVSMGLMLYGPLSDLYGRKKSIYLGIFIFLIGNLISLFSTNLSFMLIGRFLQGFGGASCRVVTLAIIRDKFEGREMGRVMSLIMILFILVPAVAPSIGQVILFFAQWRAIFVFILLAGIISVLWLHFRLPETLPKEKRLNFSFSTIIAGITETLKNPVARTYAIAAGLIFGSFVGYLSSAQQILQIQYKLGDSFAIYFGSLSLAFAFAGFTNSKLVMRFRMETLCIISLAVLSIVSFCFLLYVQNIAGQLTLFALMGYFIITFFSMGILFGNLNTLAVQPLGHIAGVATSVISSVQTLLAVTIGAVIGQNYNGTVQPLVLGFFICGVTTLAMICRMQNKEWGCCKLV